MGYGISQDLYDAIVSTFSEDHFEKWFYETKVPAFDGKTPKQVFDESGEKKLWLMLYDLWYGVM